VRGSVTLNLSSLNVLRHLAGMIPAGGGAKDCAKTQFPAFRPTNGQDKQDSGIGQDEPRMGQEWAKNGPRMGQDVDGARRQEKREPWTRTDAWKGIISGEK
jgi:hypothetical protein